MAAEKESVNLDVEIEDQTDIKDQREQINGDPTVSNELGKRKLRKLSRQHSKENPAVHAGFIHSPRSWKNSRRSRNGHGRGLPKKGGAGGKGVWGIPGSELLEAYEDFNDPNYDYESLNNGDIELKVVIPEVSMEDLKKKVEPIVLEYFENGDTHEAALSVQDTISYKFRDAFVQLSIEIAMDHKPSHREMTSVLISDLFGHVINEADITKAFENLLANLPDLILDIPDACVIVGNFVARAIADDCVPPKFLINAKNKSNGKYIQEAISRADTLLSMKHGLVRLHNVWGVGGALRPVKYLTRQMTLLLQEFISSGDIDEASRCLHALEVPHFHHELVYEAIVMALEANSVVKEEALCRLLKAFDTAVLVTQDQMERGFLRVFDDLPDICMDVPLAYIILDRFVNRCSKQDFLSDIILAKLPSRGRKRFVSEGDQQFLKTTIHVVNGKDINFKDWWPKIYKKTAVSVETSRRGIGKDMKVTFNISKFHQFSYGKDNGKGVVVAKGLINGFIFSTFCLELSKDITGPNELSKKMNRANNLYEPSDPKDAETLYQMLMESDNEEGDEIEFEDESDVEYEDFLQEQCSNSDNDQASSSSDNDSFNKNNIGCLVGKDKIKKWKTTKYLQCTKIYPHNILQCVPGIIGKCNIPKALLNVEVVQLYR
ncbi:hypothetical protein FQA39_LY17140 [Lamprigera yunnana]|nr:hypothetical protein FQA39_LY17140 [Lamprigera yunnana]